MHRVTPLDVFSLQSYWSGRWSGGDKEDRNPIVLTISFGS